MSLWLIGATCLKVMGSLWTIFFSILRLPGPYGMIFLAALGCLGLFLIGWLIYSLAGGRVDALGVLLCGRCCLLAFCGACGGNEIIEISRTKKRR
jgi:hypothetical protein